MKTFEIEIVTPETRIFKGQVTSAMFPGSEGLFQVLSNHAPIISTLGKGDIRLGIEGGQETAYGVNGGVVEVMNNSVIVLVERILSGQVQQEGDDD